MCTTKNGSLQHSPFEDGTNNGNLSLTVLSVAQTGLLIPSFKDIKVIFG